MAFNPVLCTELFILFFSLSQSQIVVSQTNFCTHSYLKKLIHQQRNLFPILLVQTILCQKFCKSAFNLPFAVVANGLRSYNVL